MKSKSLRSPVHLIASCLVMFEQMAFPGTADMVLYHYWYYPKNTVDDCFINLLFCLCQISQAWKQTCCVFGFFYNGSGQKQVSTNAHAHYRTDYVVF